MARTLSWIRAHAPAPTMPASSMTKTKPPCCGTSPFCQRASQLASVPASTPSIVLSSAVAFPDGAPARTATPRASQAAATALRVCVLPVPAWPCTSVSRSGPSMASAARAWPGLRPSNRSPRSTGMLPGANRPAASVRAVACALRIVSARAVVTYWGAPSGASVASVTRRSDAMTRSPISARAASCTDAPSRSRSALRTSVSVNAGRSAWTIARTCSGCSFR